MSLSAQHIIRHLFRVESLEEVSRQQLEELVETYPSFGVGRYLLSRKLQAEKADHFSEETQKTNLYFTNPFWLQWLLQEDLVQPVNGWGHTPSVVEDTTIYAGPSSVEETAMDTGLPAEEVFAPVVDPTEQVIDTEVPHQTEPDETGESLPAEPPPPSAADELLKSIAELKDRRQNETEQAIITPEETSPSMGIAGLALEQLEEQSIHEEPVQTEQAPIEDPSPITEQPHVEEPAPMEQVHAEEPAPTAQASSEPAPPTVTEPADAPIFEPYHTVDYFASQGIRLVLEENPSDKLGKQLKSFTDWLKVMRKLPQKNREIVPDIASERQVQAIAAHSIERKEIVTEAMAEVLAKQGMREKATEMYRKLSLLEPEKSAYFAEKIEKLKII
ncbi:MAG: hypothetical protein J0H74_06615 [Chitinophagaceae bacterium]|nr:hypothetical protein [Chitinophagaceae bacterium]